ncbi:MAG: endonuclease domain-containing protein [Gammaproteobacteria bacterium]|nr:endonuclease domain-containing protein [Gammaproteobacteria bacterium]
MQFFAKQLRRQATDTEQLLWRHLRARRLDGFKFRRQVVIEPYIVDFACLEAKLIIEADGGQHGEQQDRDYARTEYLRARGYRVLRFWNHEILTETQAVLEQIHNELIQSPHPIPSPGERGD